MIMENIKDCDDCNGIERIIKDSMMSPQASYHPQVPLMISQARSSKTQQGIS